MKKVFLYVIISVILGLSSYGQKEYTYEISAQNDNDAYLFMLLDKYYSSGLMLYFRYVPKKYNENLINKIIEFRIGQQIYSPYDGNSSKIESSDRPFAGYLFIESGISRFYNNESIFKTSLQIGILGPSAKAEEVQRFFHNIFGYYNLKGWQYQIQNTLGVNTIFSYLRSLKYFFNRKLDLNIYSDLRIGTIHSDISAGFLVRTSIFKLNPVYNSSITGSSISRNKDISFDKELFLYFKPSVSYIIYDATIEGGLYSYNNPVTYRATPFKLYLELGISGTYKNINAGYVVIFYTKEAINDMIKNHIYASIFLAFRF